MYKATALILILIYIYEIQIVKSVEQVTARHSIELRDDATSGDSGKSKAEIDVELQDDETQLRASLALPEYQAAKQNTPFDPIIVCYLGSWSVYRPNVAKFTPENINPFLCTHIIYAFAGLSSKYELKPFDSYNDITQGGYRKFTGLKDYNKQLKTLIAVGGWNEGSAR